MTWNDSFVLVAGNGSWGVASNEFSGPSHIFIDSADNLWISDYANNRIQKWSVGASSGTTEAGDVNGLSGLNPGLLANPRGLTLDQNGILYVVEESNHRVQVFIMGSLVGRIVAGSNGTATAAMDGLSSPFVIAVGNNTTMFIADCGNQRILQWRLNDTMASDSIVDLVTPFGKIYSMRLAPWSANTLYISDEANNRIVVWTMGSLTPDFELSQVDSWSTLVRPRGIVFDSYGNLLVVDVGNNRIVRYCVNSTNGETVMDFSSSGIPLFDMVDIGLDSNQNLYVVDHVGNQVVKFYRL